MRDIKSHRVGWMDGWMCDQAGSQSVVVVVMMMSECGLRIKRSVAGKVLVRPFSMRRGTRRNQE